MILSKSKYIGIALAAAGAVVLPACDDFLDVQPESSFSNEEIFSSETETKAMLGTVYSKLTNGNLYGQNFPYAFNTNTDVEMRSSSSETSSSDGQDAYCFDMGSNWNQLERTWNAAYEAINYCNDFLENMGGSPLFSTEVSSSGPSNMQHMYAEVKCLRALLYLDLVRTWGDVVYRKTSTQVGMDFYHEGVTDRMEILSDLIEDLKPAEKMLKYAAELEEGVERVGREYCQALIGQLAMYRGGYYLAPGSGIGEIKRETDYQEYYKIAREYLGKVISENKHTLTKQSFEQMWNDECNWTVLKDGDVIFEIPMLKDGSGSLGYRVGVGIDLTVDNPEHNMGRCSNSVNFCGIYPFTFDQRDLRLDVTCVPYKYDTGLSQVISVGSSCVAGWNVGKWNKMKMGTSLSGAEGNTGINAIRMRYADVLLMYAEAVNELSGPVAEAKNALKEVRRRAFEPALQNEMVEQYVDALTSPDAFFEAIKKERAWEFGGEGMRKYDLARWGIYGKTIRDLYFQFEDWGKRANGIGVRGDVRDVFYWRHVDASGNPVAATANGKRIEIMGLKEYGENIGDHPASQGWTNAPEYAKKWWSLNEDLGEWELHADIKYSFRGFINYGNASSVGPNDPIRYIAPYPSRVITAHRGSIQQQYGYR
ncbi:MAG: RagB/SusD family nutrient uptake outer membrane protein [[Clostridium] fimetarium]|nr:RagB/SusD family nutrient uptake outer membrane protein [Alistipes timonensis]MCM1405753.1 RagB/SusD family nutrient uptake outer membrane protein [[Clostridium] fimetarium]